MTSSLVQTYALVVQEGTCFFGLFLFHFFLRALMEEFKWQRWEDVSTGEEIYLARKTENMRFEVSELLSLQPRVSCQSQTKVALYMLSFAGYSKIRTSVFFFIYKNEVRNNVTSSFTVGIWKYIKRKNVHIKKGGLFTLSCPFGNLPQFGSP